MDDEKIKSGGTGNLLIDRVIHYKVSQSSKTLEEEFKNTIRKYSKDSQLNAPIVTIPFSAVDDLIENDYQNNIKKFGNNVISIYLFNSTLPSSPYYYSNSGQNGECSSSSQVGKVS